MLTEGHARLGFAVLLAFDCYLRIGELLHLRACDIALAGDPRQGTAISKAALFLRHTKTGPNQWVTLGDAAITALLAHLLACIPAPDRE